MFVADRATQPSQGALFAKSRRGLSLLEGVDTTMTPSKARFEGASHSEAKYKMYKKALLSDALLMYLFCLVHLSMFRRVFLGMCIFLISFCFSLPVVIIGELPQKLMRDHG